MYNAWDLISLASGLCNSTEKFSQFQNGFMRSSFTLTTLLSLFLFLILIEVDLFKVLIYPNKLRENQLRGNISYITETKIWTIRLITQRLKDSNRETRRNHMVKNKKLRLGLAKAEVSLLSSSVCKSTY